MCIVFFDWSNGRLRIVANREESIERPRTEPKRIKLAHTSAVIAPGPAQVKFKKLEQGIHCITNMGLDDPGDNRIKFIMAHDDPLGIGQHLAMSDEIVRDDANWCTLCSSVIEIGGRFWHAQRQKSNGVVYFNHNNYDDLVS